MKTPGNKEPVRQKEQSIEQNIRRRTFLSFATFFVAGGITYKGWKWLYTSPKEAPGITGNAHVPLRRALNKTELFFRKFFSPNHHVKTYPKSRAAKNVRVNSEIGMKEAGFNPENWKLSVIKSNGALLKITIEEIKAIPKSEIVFDFKCVEGWDQIQHWAGVRFIDFIDHFQLQEVKEFKYVGMETPSGEYYVGLDMESALHPQTLLAYEMNDEKLTMVHGAPLRLIIPVKYGIKSLKRIGKITFSNERPRDYWALRGYDYYSGL